MASGGSMEARSCGVSEVREVWPPRHRGWRLRCDQIRRSCDLIQGFKDPLAVAWRREAQVGGRRGLLGAAAVGLVRSWWPGLGGGRGWRRLEGTPQSSVGRVLERAEGLPGATWSRALLVLGLGQERMATSLGGPADRAK